MSKKSRDILTFDVETSPIDAWTWGVWQQNIPIVRLKEPTFVLTYAAKFDNEKVVYRTYDQPDFLSTLHAMMNRAQLIVGYNHDKFDLRHMNREFAIGGLTPVRPCPTIDLLKVVKKNFHFPHNKLEYVAQQLLGESKLDTGGFELWPAFMEGNEKALRLMKKYNIKDTVLTEKLYDYLLPWIKNHPYLTSREIYIPDDEIVYECPSCESKRIDRQRPRRTRCFAIRVNLCLNCGTYSEGRRKKIS